MKKMKRLRFWWIRTRVRARRTRVAKMRALPSRLVWVDDPDDRHALSHIDDLVCSDCGQAIGWWADVDDDTGRNVGGFVAFGRPKATPIGPLWCEDCFPGEAWAAPLGIDAERWDRAHDPHLHITIDRTVFDGCDHYADGKHQTVHGEKCWGCGEPIMRALQVMGE